MIGFTHDEMHAIISGNSDIENATDQQIEAGFFREFGDAWQSFLEACKKRVPGGSAMEILSLGLNIANFEGQTREFASALSDRKINVWLYRFDWKSPKGKFGACHCIELPFLFNTFQEWSPPMISGSEKIDLLNLSRALQKTWGEFAKRGNPNNNSITHWPRFSNKNRSELRWNKYVEVVQKYR